MRERGPLITVLVVLVLGTVVLAVNLMRAPTDKPAAQAVGSNAAAAPASGPSARPAPPPAAQAAPEPAGPPAGAQVAPGPAPGPPGPNAAPPAAPGPPGPNAAPPAAATPFPGQAKYTGHTDGNRAAIAITVRNDQVSAYLCDGKAIEGWYQGSASNGRIDAKGAGANALQGSLKGSTLSGTVSAGGKSWTYNASPATSPAGLYRAQTGNRTTGWIKGPDGQVTGLAHQNGTIEPAAPLDATSVESVEGGDRVVAR